MNNIEIKIKKEQLIQSIKDNISESKLTTVETSILNTKDAFLSYLFLKEISTKRINEHLKVICDSNDYQTIYSTAMEIKCDKTLLQKKIMDSGIAKWMYFIGLAEGIDIEALEDAIIKTGDLPYIFMFGSSNPYCNKQKIAEYVISTNNPEYIGKLGCMGINSDERSNLIYLARQKNIEEYKRSLKK